MKSGFRVALICTSIAVLVCFAAWISVIKPGRGSPPVLIARRPSVEEPEGGLRKLNCLFAADCETATFLREQRLSRVREQISAAPEDNGRKWNCLFAADCYVVTILREVRQRSTRAAKSPGQPK